jgi:hypothetical protein
MAADIIPGPWRPQTLANDDGGGTLGSANPSATILRFQPAGERAMSDPDRRFIDPDAPCPKEGEVRPGATVIEGVAHNGRPCRIVDNTGRVDPTELKEVLNSLIADKRFGLGGMSAKGGNTINLSEPAVSPVQFGDQLYRLLLFPYEARVEPF